MPQTTAAPATDIQQLADRYGDAWNSQDPDAIVALHTPDSVFYLHIPGGEPVHGVDAIREAFAGFIGQLPDIHFEPVRLQVGGDFWVLESVMSGTAAAPFEVDGEQLDAPGAKVEVDCVDVIQVRDGLVSRKETYIDALTFEQQLGARQ